jgi:hypothetical protein
VAAALLCAVSASAQSAPEPYPDFTFKRVTVPKAGSGPRINVQVTETVSSPVPEDDTASAPVAPSRNTGGAFDWYWADISPALADSAPGRLDAAVAQLSNGPGVAAPRLSTLQPIIAAHNSDILLATIGTQVSPALVLSVIVVESSGNPQAVSSAGATGVNAEVKFPRSAEVIFPTFGIW